MFAKAAVAMLVGLAFGVPVVMAAPTHSGIAECQVPTLTGVTLSKAQTRAKRAGCLLRVRGSYPGKAGDYLVVRQTRSLHRYRGKLRISVWVRPTSKCRFPERTELPPEYGREPFSTRGKTVLITGLYLVGGPPPLPVVQPSCSAPKPVLSPGTLTVTSAGTVVSQKAVKAGQSARIMLAPGSYVIQATFANATVNGQPLASDTKKITITAGQSTRQDLIGDIT